MYFVLEGIDGIGKDYYAKLIQENWWGRNELVVFREPRDEAFMQALRMYIGLHSGEMSWFPERVTQKLNALAYTMDRYMHMTDERFVSALHDVNKDILQIRSFLSTMVYQRILCTSYVGFLSYLYDGRLPELIILLWTRDFKRISNRLRKRGEKVEVSVLEDLQNTYFKAAEIVTCKAVRKYLRRPIEVVKINIDSKNDQAVLDLIQAAFWNTIEKLRKEKKG